MQFHQVLEYLPPETRIIVPATLSQTQKRTLQVLGIAEERLAYFDPNDEVTVEELYFIPPPTITRFDDPEPMNWLRNKLREGFGLNRSDRVSSRRIYVSRSKAASRRVVNEGQLMALLSGYGFELVHCEDISIVEQARLFSEAEAVVAPHGAGLTNLLFSTASVKVLEIFPESLIGTHYWSLTGALGQTYCCLCGKSVSNGRLEPDIFVDPDKVQRALDALDVRPH